jgi:membrane protease YdiL (CAAX protease family)
MLSVKRWRTEAIARLLLSVMICIFLGSLAVIAFHYAGSAKKPAPRFYVLAAGSGVLLATALVLMRKPWERENYMPRVLAVAIPFYAGFLLGLWAESIAGPPPDDLTAGQVLVAGLSFQGATLVLIGFFLRGHLVGWKEGFGFGNHLRQTLLAGVFAACLFFPVGLALQGESARLMEHYKMEPKEQEAVRALATSTTWTYPLSLGFVAVLLAPLAEETLFRGILYPAIKFAGFPRLAWLATSLLFAAVHLSVVTFVPLFLLAVLLTFLYERTNNLAASITAHALFNTLNFVWFFVQKKAQG